MLKILYILMILSNGGFAVNQKYICTVNRTVEMESDSVVFFESPDFPRIMTNDERQQCFINFTKALTIEEQDKRFVIVTSNAFCDECENLLDVQTNITSYLFESNVYTAFQGFAYFDDWGDDCPLESVSRIQPFQFTDVTQILEIRYTYDSYPKKRSCLWQFKAPEDFGFKIVFTDFFITNNVILKVENTRDTFITSANAKQNYPYYTIDNYIKVYLSEFNFSNPEISDIVGFTASITMLKNNLNHTLIDCSVKKQRNHTLWSWDGSNFGFPNNARCTYTLKILPKTEVIAQLNYLDVEYYVDAINYYEYNSDIPNINGPIFNIYFRPDILTFATNEDVEREILWEFKSDGTVNSQNFEVDFEKKYCSCANPLIIVQCDAVSTTYLMEDSGSSGFYCGNLECNFTIKLNSSCASKFIALKLDGGDIKDTFIVISNNITIPNLMIGDQNVYLPSINHNVLKVITFESVYERVLKIISSAANGICFVPSSCSRVYLYETCSNDINLHSIDLSSDLKQKNATIDFFVYGKHDLNDLRVYSDISLTYQLNLQDCIKEVVNSVYRCKTNKDSVIWLDTCISYLIFQVTIGGNVLGNEGCVFKNNVFNFEKAFSAMSNTEKTCKIICITDLPFNNYRIWISPHTNGSINIFANTAEKLFATIDTSEILLWHDLLINPNIYIIEIPLNSLIMSTGQYHSNRNITDTPYKTIVTSPFYGRNSNFVSSFLDCLGQGTHMDTFDIPNTKSQVTVLDMDVDSSNYFYFITNNTQINITSTLHSIIFEPGHYDLYCVCELIEHCSIRLLLETVNFTEATTIKTSRSTLYLTTSHSSLTTTETSFCYTSTMNYFLLLLQGLVVLKFAY